MYAKCMYNMVLNDQCVKYTEKLDGVTSFTLQSEHLWAVEGQAVKLAEHNMKLGWAPEPGSYCHRKPGWWLQMASLQIITEKYHHGSCSAVAKYHHLNIISAIYCQYSWKLSSWQNVALLPMVLVSSTSTKSNPLFFYCLCLALELDRSMLMIAAVGLIAGGVHNNLNTLTKYRSKDAGNCQDFRSIQNPKKKKIF